MGRHPKSAEVRGRFWRARASGASLREAARAAGVSRTAGHYWLKESGGVRPRTTAPRPELRLSLAEREEISRGLAKKETLTSIAARLGRSVSTISREVKRNATAAGYRAYRADRMADAKTHRPRPGKLAANEALRTRVEEKLKAKWSPQQIAARLRLDHPDDPSMWVSHETIYTSLFVQAKVGYQGNSRCTFEPDGSGADHSVGFSSDLGASPTCASSILGHPRSRTGSSSGTGKETSSLEGRAFRTSAPSWNDTAATWRSSIC